MLATIISHWVLSYFTVGLSEKLGKQFGGGGGGGGLAVFLFWSQVPYIKQTGSQSHWPPCMLGLQVCATMPSSDSIFKPRTHVEGLVKTKERHTATV